jgi:hypothetical protein
MIITAPKGWRADKVEHRFAGGTPSSYNATDHTATCVISAGASVDRIFGREVLTISRAAIDLSRIPCPLLDSHSQTSIDSILGVIESAWISNGELYGKIRFAQTPRGRLAEGMVARGEITGISAGYKVLSWLVTDADGNVVDESNASWSDELTFVAERWQLYEASLVGIPADIASAIRKAGGGIDSYSVETVRARMQARSRMQAAAGEMSNDEDADVAEIIDRAILRHAEMEERSALLDAELEIADHGLN